MKVKIISLDKKSDKLVSFRKSYSRKRTSEKFRLITKKEIK